ncbi:nucleotidyl transferase AbiEii/AbiGii toxin family protein [Candidatus Shapirobacteria bacterium]|nr:nucleotidyl transferase AbiEii/AbiGii toxin family protein [Candidatus Shapirobacteria bacterium]
MNEQLAFSLAKKINISLEQVVREEYEIIILKKLFESDLGKYFVFKGGTALRLAYGSSRFSEDLDFSVVKSFKRNQLKQLLKEIDDQDSNLQLNQALQKKNTYFALFKVKQDFLPQAFSIKFEASVRPIAWKKNIDYQLATLNSQVTSLTVLAQVASLKRINKDKKRIKPLRIRDIFDLWFISQKLGSQFQLDFSSWPAKIVKRELNKYLPLKERELISQWLPEK